MVVLFLSLSLNAKDTPESIAINFLIEYDKQGVNQELIDYIRAQKNLTKYFKHELIRYEYAFILGICLEYDCPYEEKDFIPEEAMLVSKYYKGDHPIIYGNGGGPSNYKVVSNKNGYILLSGVDWLDYRIYVKVINVDGKFMIDGAGMVNIPEELYNSIHSENY
ncbi:hypothetical protein CCORG_0606 [Campylobacter corcagiensis]|nr:hypothetical protein CCORG_0606 [Campylobacter corcagiensis]